MAETAVAELESRFETVDELAPKLRVMLAVGPCKQVTITLDRAALNELVRRLEAAQAPRPLQVVVVQEKAPGLADALYWSFLAWLCLHSAVERAWSAWHG
jgi:hypothetical protein